MAAEDYPHGGFDVDPNSEHELAELAEAYTHAVAAFREKVIGKLAACGALAENGFGWAIFGGEEIEEGRAEDLRREVLIMSDVRPEALQRTDPPLPMIRIITNEPVISEDGKFFYLTEDATVLESGHALYMVDAVQRVAEDNDDEASSDSASLLIEETVLESDEVDEIDDQEIADKAAFTDDELELEDELEGDDVLTASPLFFVPEDNRLLIMSQHQKPLTPYVRLEDTETETALYPFGSARTNIEDDMYALNGARAILDAVMNTEPSHAFRSAAES